MIVHFVGSLKEILQQGRKYLWPRIEKCPRCKQAKVWGHGYVAVWFDGYDRAIEMRRYRCPLCRCVIKMRPEGYFERFQCLKETVRRRIVERITTGRWPPGMSRQRQGHWLRSLRRKVVAHLGNEWKEDLIKGYDVLMKMGINAVSRSI